MATSTIIAADSSKNMDKIDVHFPLLVTKHPAFAASPVNPFVYIQGLMFNLMLRNVATDGYVFADPLAPRFSVPGCIIASPSYQANTPTEDQDYIYNWTRDAAMTAFELSNAPSPFDSPSFIQVYLENYVNFASICQNSCNGTGTPVNHACFNIDGSIRSWGNQSDGPASQIIAILAAYSQLGAASQAQAVQVIQTNLDFLLQNNNYQQSTTNLWEETSGISFYARAVMLRCFNQLLAANLPAGILKLGQAAAVKSAAGWLTTASNWLQQFWNGSYYQSIVQGSGRGTGLDADVVMAAVYGDLNQPISNATSDPYRDNGISDNNLLATAAQIRDCWKNAPINQDTAHGPMIGRYSGDTYEGGNAWLLCTANFAEFYYRLALAINGGAQPNLGASFFAQVGVSSGTSPLDVIRALVTAGDKMMQGVLYHSDHLELSEQVRWDNGYEVSVRDLTWSYAAFLSAVRARSAVAAVPGL
jgi:glucoamylase